MYGLYSFLFDEDVPETIWNAIEQHNAKGSYLIDVIRVGDPAAPPKRSTDPATLPDHFNDHLNAGLHSPGVIVLRVTDVTSVVNHLVEVAHCGLPGDWLDILRYFP
jgi:hypothetical protein